MKANLTAATINRLTCPPGAQQAFLTNTAGAGLKVRVHHDAIETWVLAQAGIAHTPREKRMLAIAK
mgnify:CR=1 FL=1